MTPRARLTRALPAALGLVLVALSTGGCPEPADLANPESYMAPPPSSGGSGGSSSGAECESACMAEIINLPGLGCKTCHGKTVKLAGTLDLESPGYTGRLKDKVAEHPGVMPGDCGTGEKLIDTANPSASWIYKKVTGMEGNCGEPMPAAPGLAAAQQMCVLTYVTCVANGPGAPVGGASAGGSGGSASGGAGAGTGGSAAGTGGSAAGTGGAAAGSGGSASGSGGTGGA